MVALICLPVSPFKSKSRLGAENAALRQQLNILWRKVKNRAKLTNNDRWFFIQLYRWFPSILEVVTIFSPETLVRWHRSVFHSPMPQAVRRANAIKSTARSRVEHVFAE